MNKPFVRYINIEKEEKVDYGFTRGKYFVLSGQGITEILEVFGQIGYLDCSSNYLKSLPKLPDSIQILECQSNELTSLPPHLPRNLRSLDCSKNQLTSLPELPKLLSKLILFRNKLTSLPDLPPSIKHIFAANNKDLKGEINLDNLSNLEYLNITNTQLILEWSHQNIPYNLGELEIGKSIPNLRVVKKLKKALPDLKVVLE